KSLEAKSNLTEAIATAREILNLYPDDAYAKAYMQKTRQPLVDEARKELNTAIARMQVNPDPNEPETKAALDKAIEHAEAIREKFSRSDPDGCLVYGKAYDLKGVPTNALAGLSIPLPNPMRATLPQI